MLQADYDPPHPVSTRRRRTWQEASFSPQQDNNNYATNNDVEFVESSHSPFFHALLPWNELPLQSTIRGLLNQSNNNRKTIYITTSLLFGGFLLLISTLTRRESTIYSPHEIPILIPALQTDHADNLGGWYVGSPRRYLPERILKPNELLDTGGLILLPLRANQSRAIRPHDDRLFHEEKAVQIEQMDKEYISKRHYYADELEDIEMECQRPSFEKHHFPTCNGFHEFDLSRTFDTELAKRIGDDQQGQSFYLSHGYFRDVFSVSQPFLNSKAVLKVARYAKHEMNFRPLFNARRDALIMERLSGSPRIVDIYGFCGSSIFVEHLPHEVEEVIVPGGGWIKQKDLHDSKDVDIQNHYTAEEKLSIALEMAESIAVLHGYKEGVIVHDDIQLCQWLRNDEGKLKLGDFNRARVLGWNEEKQEYCKYENGRGYGNYRSPEEYSEQPLSQQHDVWSFGNNIYALLTGLWIFYENEDDEVVSEKIVNGTRPFIDPRYRSRSFIERRLVEIAEKCWTYDLDKRPDIFEIVKELRKVVKDSRKAKNK